MLPLFSTYVYMKIYTFKTNINSLKTANILLNLLPYYYKISQIKFQQKKGGGFFTIKAKNLTASEVQTTIKEFGYRCQLMKDD